MKTSNSSLNFSPLLNKIKDKNVDKIGPKKTVRAQTLIK